VTLAAYDAVMIPNVDGAHRRHCLTSRVSDPARAGTDDPAAADSCRAAVTHERR
jgi:hypothetical protein